MVLSIDRDALAQEVEREAADASGLARLATATQAAAELAAIGDGLLDRYVTAARDEGRSWSEIGQVLGVTRQAAHLRFADRSARAVPARMDGFTEAARTTVVAGQEIARRRGHNYVGTEHVLLALTAQQDELGGTILRDLGITEAVVGERIEEIIGRGGQQCSGGPTQFAPRVKRSFERARGYAKQLGQRRATTEHLLLGLVEVDGVAAEILTAGGIPPTRLTSEVARALGVDAAELRGQRRGARRRKR